MSNLVLSASVLGTKCLRRLWFIANGAEGLEVDEKVKRVFDIGRALEPLAIEWEKSKGRDVFYNAKTHYDPPDFVIDLGDGTIVGRFDAIFDKQVLVDIKTCSTPLFIKLLEGHIPHMWLVQVNVYFFGLKIAGCRDDIKDLIDGLSKVGVYAIHKENGRTIEVLRDPDLEIFTDVLRKAKRVFIARTPYELEADRSECTRCEFRELRCVDKTV
jgi:hypothetical protein